MIRALNTLMWAVRLEWHVFLQDFYAGRDFAKYWQHKERVRYCQARIIQQRN